MENALTPDEIRQARAYLNEQHRKWWNAMTPEQRRAKRMQYARAAAEKAAKKKEG